MTEPELLELIGALRAFEGDTSGIEAKRAATRLPERLWETLSAFANTPGGGVVILGLDEASGFAPVGVVDPDKAQKDMASLCDQMDPPLRPLISLHQLDGRILLTAEVPELGTEQKPCYYRGAGLTNGAFVRVADGDRRLTPYEVQAMLASRGQPREDEAPVPRASVDDLDKDLVALYLQRLRADDGGPFRSRTDRDVLRTTGVLVPDEREHLVPSLGGLLALGRHPQEFYPSLGMTFVVFPTEGVGEVGPGGERFLDNRRLEGPVPTLVLGAMDALKRNMKRRAVVHGLLREDLWEYPEEALREALVNALVHRDFSPGARGTPVQVQMFPDRLVTSNPGGLFGPVTLDRLGEGGISAARNQTLLRILEDLPVPGDGRTLCENRGSGIGAMMASLRRAGMQPPTFENSIASFRVVLPNHTLLDAETVQWLARFVPLGLSRHQQFALAFVRRNGSVTNIEYRRLTGQDSRDASKELRRLVDADLLRQVGTRRWTEYRLPTAGDTQVEPFDPIAGAAGQQGHGQAIERLLRDGGPRSRREIAGALGLTPSTALYWLRRLIAAGTVAPTAPPRSKDARYRWRPPSER